eukprot:4445792-Alexandrium_andersonii.AAC.1
MALCASVAVRLRTDRASAGATKRTGSRDPGAIRSHLQFCDRERGAARSRRDLGGAPPSHM